MDYSFYTCPACATRSADMQLVEGGSPDSPSRLDTSGATAFEFIAHERLKCRCGKVWSWHELTKNTTVLSEQ